MTAVRIRVETTEENAPIAPPTKNIVMIAIRVGNAPPKKQQVPVSVLGNLP